MFHNPYTGRSDKQITVAEDFLNRARPLPRLAESLKRKGMTWLFDMDDRARLRERFYGAIHTVLARL